MSIFLKVTGEEESFPLYTSFSEEEVKREAQRVLVISWNFMGPQTDYLCFGKKLL
jgi:hypothetical protein